MPKCSEEDCVPAIWYFMRGNSPEFALQTGIHGRLNKYKIDCIRLAGGYGTYSSFVEPSTPYPGRTSLIVSVRTEMDFLRLL